MVVLSVGTRVTSGVDVWMGVVHGTCECSVDSVAGVDIGTVTVGTRVGLGVKTGRVTLWVVIVVTGL